jgi:predicted nucleic acid-binding protein
MSVLVIDASVAVGVVVQDDTSQRSKGLLHAAIIQNDRVIARPHFFGEVHNAIYQPMRRGSPALRLAADDARASIQELELLPIESVNPAGVYRCAFELALTYQLQTIYDGLYVALADMLQAPL